jgi:hypothetical protein
MRERPKGVAVIHEVDGDKDIIVVIPTADYNGKYARSCRENIFKGVHIIFVESGEVPDPYFNYAHNCNFGIEKALEYNPNWIIISNDDVQKADNITILMNELRRMNSSEIALVFTQPAEYHSIPARFSMPRFTRYLILIYRMNLKRQIKLVLGQRKIERKYGCSLFVNPRRGLTHFMYKEGFDFISFTDFGIFSAAFIKSFSGTFFDETFINGHEDHDISISSFLERRSYAFINFKIYDCVGATFGTGISRELRNLAGNVYLNYKHYGVLSEINK